MRFIKDKFYSFCDLRRLSSTKKLKKDQIKFWNENFDKNISTRLLLSDRNWYITDISNSSMCNQGDLNFLCEISWQEKIAHVRIQKSCHAWGSGDHHPTFFTEHLRTTAFAYPTVRKNGLVINTSCILAIFSVIFLLRTPFLSDVDHLAV